MRSTTNNKKTSNLIIALGYCVVTVVLLMNYVFEPAGRLVTPRMSVTETIQPKELSANTQNDSIEKRLEEEKKLNRELRGIITSLQGSTASLKSGVSASASQTSDKRLPRLNTETINRALSKKPNPFIVGKNPFAYNKKIVVPVSEKPQTSNLENLQPDLYLPFVISGSSSKFECVSNF